MTREELIEHMARAAYNAEPVISRGGMRPSWENAHVYEKTICRGRAAAHLDAISAAGFAVVPKTPTHGMIQECDDELEILDGTFVSRIEDGLIAAITGGDVLKVEPI